MRPTYDISRCQLILLVHNKHLTKGRIIFCVLTVTSAHKYGLMVLSMKNITNYLQAYTTKEITIKVEDYSKLGSNIFFGVGGTTLI